MIKDFRGKELDMILIPIMDHGKVIDTLVNASCIVHMPNGTDLYIQFYDNINVDYRAVEVKGHIVIKYYEDLDRDLSYRKVRRNGLKYTLNYKYLYYFA